MVSFTPCFSHNHLRNVWVKNFLYSLTGFLIAHLDYGLDEVAPELHVSPRFMSLACSFDKMFSLCENYPKVLGESFLQWFMDHHYGGLLFHVERVAYCGRQDVASMAAMEILWNINYCVDFLDDMISYCGKSENILTCSIIILLSSVDIIPVYQLWSMLHIAIVVPMRWLSVFTHKMKEYGWRYISVGKVLDKLKDELNMIVYQP